MQLSKHFLECHHRLKHYVKSSMIRNRNLLSYVWRTPIPTFIADFSSLPSLRLLTFLISMVDRG